MVQRRMAHSMCQLGDWIYVFGGMDEKQTFVTSVERIKLESNGKWELVCELPKPMCNVGILITQTEILLLGGKGLESTYNTVYLYDG